MDYFNLFSHISRMQFEAVKNGDSVWQLTSSIQEARYGYKQYRRIIYCETEPTKEELDALLDSAPIIGNAGRHATISEYKTGCCVLLTITQDSGD